jgi:hypothetical protein
MNFEFVAVCRAGRCRWCQNRGDSVLFGGDTSSDGAGTAVAAPDESVGEFPAVASASSEAVDSPGSSVSGTTFPSRADGATGVAAPFPGSTETSGAAVVVSTGTAGPSTPVSVT